jgi:hypothetical protein
MPIEHRRNTYQVIQSGKPKKVESESLTAKCLLIMEWQTGKMSEAV